MFVAWNYLGVNRQHDIAWLFFLKTLSFASQGSELQSQPHQQAALVGALWIREPSPTLQMSTFKMKGLLKGLRYISQIFESADDDDEPEMQIGLPTDVKHVAHIGWDGPSVSSPSWMNEFKTSPEFSSSTINANKGAKSKPGNKCPDQDPFTNTTNSTSRRKDLPELPKSARNPNSTGPPSPDIPKPSRNHQTSSQNSPDKPKQSRRHQSTSAAIMSPGEPITGNSPWQSPSSAPKQSRKKKSKEPGEEGGLRRGPSRGGSRRVSKEGPGSIRSRSKGQSSATYVSAFSDPGIASGPVPGPDPVSALRGLQLEEKRGDAVF